MRTFLSLIDFYTCMPVDRCKLRGITALHYHILIQFPNDVYILCPMYVATSNMLPRLQSAMQQHVPYPYDSVNILFSLSYYKKVKTVVIDGLETTRAVCKLSITQRQMTMVIIAIWVCGRNVDKPHMFTSPRSINCIKKRGTRCMKKNHLT